MTPSCGWLLAPSPWLAGLCSLAGMAVVAVVELGLSLKLSLFRHLRLLSRKTNNFEPRLAVAARVQGGERNETPT